MKKRVKKKRILQRVKAAFIKSRGRKDTLRLFYFLCLTDALSERIEGRGGESIECEEV